LVFALEAAMSTKKKFWLFLSLLLVLAGCGGASNSPPAAKSADGAPRAQGFSGGAPGDVQPSSTSPASPGFSGFPQAGQPAPPPAEAKSEESSRASREPAPESRPGLGTEWGETRSSRVHDVTFVRDSSRPFAIATMNYNDRNGVQAMMNAKGVRDTSRNISTGGGAITISLKDANGNNLEAVRVADKTLVIGQAGQRYSIVLTNHTGHRFESVVTVDGLDVINGKPGTAENRGYVLLPFATLEIEGFRQSANAVAAFRFASVSESYAAQTGSARNVGVIGVAFFGERGDSFDSPRELELRDSASPFPADPRFAQPPRR
jgi:hypothetical protein